MQKIRTKTCHKKKMKLKIKENMEEIDVVTQQKINKQAKKEYQRNYQVPKKYIHLFYSIRMSEKILKFGDVEVNKNEYRASKQPIALNLVNINQIVVSDKFKRSGKCFKYFIGYKDNDIIRPLYIVLPQMKECIKYFDNGGKNMSFKIGGNSVMIKYNDIWNIVKKLLSIKFYSTPVYDKKHIRTKVKTFNGVVNTKFQNDGIPKENVH